MNKEHADKLYSKLNKSVPKSKRKYLQKALVEADDIRLGKLDVIRTAVKRPIRDFKSSICFFALLFGMVFIVLNMVTFLVINPKCQGYSRLSSKFADELKLTYERTAKYGNAENADGAEGLVVKFSDKYFDGLSEEYDEEFSEYQRLCVEYNAAYGEYIEDVGYVNNKTENYLKPLIDLAELNEPGEGDKDYDKKKEEYEGILSALKKKIEEYNAKESQLSDKYSIVTDNLEKCLISATKCAEKLSEMTEYRKQYEIRINDSYKIEAYGKVIGNYAGFINYLNGCNERLTEQIKNYTALFKSFNDYESSSAVLSRQLDVYKEDYVMVYNNYLAAKADLDGFLTDCLAHRTEYEAFVDSNALELRITTKILEDIDLKYNKIIELAKDDGAVDVKNEFTDAIKALLNEYKDAFEKFTEETDKQNDESYLIAKAVYERLEEALNGKNEEETLQAVLKLYSENKIWKEKYDEKAEAYAVVIKRDSRVTDEFGLIVSEIDIAAQQNEITALKEIFGSSLWTDEYYVNYCTANKNDADYQLKKSTYEIYINTDKNLNNRLTEINNIVNTEYSLKADSILANESLYGSLDAYYNAEQLTLRLQAAVNIMPDLMRIVSDCYNTMANDEAIDWLTVNDEARKRVLKDLNFNDTRLSEESYVNSLTLTDLNALIFEDFDAVSDVEKLGRFIDGLGFAKKITAFANETDRIDSLRNDCNTLTSDYLLLPDIMRMLIIIYDIIALAIAACYFAYIVGAGINKTKEENFENILDVLST